MKEDWVEVKLGEICNVKMGQSPPSETYNTDKNGLPFFQGKAEFTEIHPIAKKWCTSPKKVANKDDILISVRAPVGATNIADQKCAIGRGLAAITYKYSNSYVWHYLKSIEKKLDNQGTGTTFKAISGTVLKSQIFPLPPLPIQRAIITKIENLFASLDKGIEDLTKAREQLKVYRQAVLKKAFEGEFTKEWREKQTNLPTAEELLDELKKERQRFYEKQVEDWKEAVKEWEENGKEGKKPKKPTSLIKELSIDISILPKIPVLWEYINIDFATYKLGDGLHGTPSYSTHGDHYFINGNNLGGKHICIKKNTKRVDKSEYLKHKRDLNNDTVLVSINGTIGNTSFYNNEKVILGKSACYFNLLPLLDKQFIRWRIDSLEFRNYAFKNATGSTIKNVPLKAMRDFAIPLCSKEEQHQIVREIESRLSVCDKLEQSITEGLEKAEALRQSILKKAFEGKLLSEAEIEKCKQEADYEPASVLLERIKKEKKK
ncbi:restriction endonuclease subunit S [Marinilabilia rubra]|uniref:Restriction endonuclease subunit S n=1 Tax=Marinilabilia rubra TaxID=2162893 RepID=A0A2U2B954_9BACT|nr:restriction endonuclease subunit S [Marinilabilia rubra]PWD99598.1 restriction endonuclease subunit S [Marinilabilia rubra]